MNSRRFFLVFSIAFLFCARGFAVESSVEEPWVLGAQKFDLNENRNYSKAVESTASLLPKLILQQISLDTTRTIYRDEQVAKKTDSLLTDRLSLFLQLGKEVKSRDALVLNNYTMFEYKRALKAQEKKINEVQKKIDDNLKTQKEVLFPSLAKKKSSKKNEWEPFTKNISLYREDSESLFSPSENALEHGIDSRAFAKEISSAKISGLITGSMVAYGNYLSVSTELFTFPGAKKIASVTEVGTLNEIREIAERIAFALLPKIANGLPVEIEFKIYPEEAIQTARLTIDNIVYTPFPEKATVTSGIHSISIEADGYARQSFAYNFSEKSKFLVEANLTQKYDGAVQLALSNYVPGSMFFDGKYVGDSSPIDFATIPLKVNGRNVFGYFEGTLNDKDGERTETMFMMIPENLLQDGAQLETKMRVFDVSKNIDKRRKRMYIAYSALLISLPFLFYSYGRFTTLQAAYTNGYGSIKYKDLILYRNLSFAGIGLASACGAWMLTELVLYLVAVDKTLPPRAKKVKSRTLRKMEMERELLEAETETDAETETEIETENIVGEK